MTKDFSKYQHIIDHFKGDVLTPDFDARFAVKVDKIPKADRFLLKMELKRLASECTRLIDLRGQVEGECRAYEHEGRTHLLDSLAIKVFEENVAYYGRYTFAVYEAVMRTKNNFKVMYKNRRNKSDSKSDSANVPEKIIIEKTHYPAQLVTFSSYENRMEERMNFAIPVEIFAENDLQFDATTSDISVVGCRLRVATSHSFSVGEFINIRFVGLEGEFEFGNNNKFNYQICNVQKINGAYFLGCLREFPEGIVTDAFKEFLHGFIQGNKRRYKINLDNTISALQTRTFEHFVLPEINEMPVFIQKTEQGYYPRLSLTCDNNKAIFTYWQNEAKQSTLDYLLSNDRISKLVDGNNDTKSILVYSFVHLAQGKTFFYSADDIQLAGDKDFKHQYLGFCASKPTFGVFELSILPVDSNHVLSPFTLSNSLRKKDEYLNLPPPVETQKIINKLSHIVVIKDLTNPELLPHYQSLDFDGIDISKLKVFGHKRQRKTLRIDESSINYKNQRQEARFKYETEAIVSAEDVVWHGKSADFSMSGLKIVLDKPAVVKRGDIVILNFPALQKITKDFDLSALPYEVMSVNPAKTIINCRVHIEKHQHIGRSFFKLLIDKNRSKLTPDEYTMMTPGLSKALRNIYSASIASTFLLIQTSGSRYKFNMLTSSDEHGQLMPKLRELSDTEGRYNLYPLLSDLEMMSELTATFKKMSNEDTPLTYTLYISIKNERNSIAKSVKVMQAKSLKQPEQRAFYINNARNNGEFFAVQLKVSRVKDPDLVYLNPELAYIGSYAIHKAKQIEQEICSVVGSVEIVDITSEVLALHDVML